MLLCCVHGAVSDDGAAFSFVFLGQLAVLLKQPSLLDNDGIQIEFALGSLNDLLFHSIARHQAVDKHVPRLSNAVGTVDCLRVNAPEEEDLTIQ